MISDLPLISSVLLSNSRFLVENSEASQVFNVHDRRFDLNLGVMEVDLLIWTKQIVRCKNSGMVTFILL